MISQKIFFSNLPRVISIIFLMTLPYYSKAQDYSSYEIAKKYEKDHNYLLAYKHLIIFKFTNFEILHKPINKDALTKLESSIASFEQYLLQNYATGFFDLKKIRGFSDTQIDSLTHVKQKEIAIPLIPIQ